VRDIEERRLYPVGIRAKIALVGEIVRWDSYPSRDVFERQQLAEGCREIAARVVPPNKNAVGWPPIGDLVEPQLAVECLEALAIVVVRVMANGGPASPRRQPGQPDGRGCCCRHRGRGEKLNARCAQRPRPRNHFGACRWVASLNPSRGGCAQSLPRCLNCYDKNPTSITHHGPRALKLNDTPNSLECQRHVASQSGPHHK
jgi:hypothetical protein